MTRDDFKKIIDNTNAISDFNKKLYDLGINVENEIVYTTVEHLTEILIRETFGNDAYDWFEWWMYELPFLKGEMHKKPYARKADGTPIVLDTADDLYDFLVTLKEENNA